MAKKKGEKRSGSEFEKASDQKSGDATATENQKKGVEKFKLDGSTIPELIVKIGNSYAGSRRYIRSNGAVYKGSPEHREIIFTGTLARVDLAEDLVCFVNERFGKNTVKIIEYMMKNLIDDLREYGVDVTK